MLDLLVRRPSSHALMIYPMKALAFDQREQIRQICSRPLRPHDRRPVSARVSLGALPPHQRRCKITRITGSAWQYPDVYPCFTRQITRRQGTRYLAVGARRILYHGSRLPGRLQATASAHAVLGLLRHSGQHAVLNKENNL